MKVAAPDMIISITPPEARLFDNLNQVFLHQLFLHDDFSIEIEVWERRLRFMLPLQEWLPELAKYIRLGNVEPADILLATSGDRFRIEREQAGFRIGVFDMLTRSSQCLTFSTAQMRTFHTILVDALVATTNRVAGRPLPIADIGRVTIDDGAWAQIQP